MQAFRQENESRRVGATDICENPHDGRRDYFFFFDEILNDPLCA
jgi:hypothetical protein